MQLKERLKAVCDFITPGNVVADIGTDHAYLPIYLIEQGIAPRALATDVHAGPYRAAGQAVRRAGLGDKIDVRFGDGIATLAPGEAATAVIAGMGGKTMTDILAAKPNVTASFVQLVLQPMNAAKILRSWLIEHGWRIVAENLVFEDGRLYEIISAEPGRQEELKPILYEVGPKLWADRHSLLKYHIAALLAQTKKVLAGMEAGAHAPQQEKYRREKQKAVELGELLQCL